MADSLFKTALMTQEQPALVCETSQVNLPSVGFFGGGTCYVDLSTEDMIWREGDEGEALVRFDNSNGNSEIQDVNLNIYMQVNITGDVNAKKDTTVNFEQMAMSGQKSSEQVRLVPTLPCGEPGRHYDFDFVSSNEISDDFEVRCRFKSPIPGLYTMNGYNFTVKFYLAIQGQSNTRCSGLKSSSKDKNSNERNVGTRMEILVLPRIPPELGGNQVYRSKGMQTKTKGKALVMGQSKMEDPAGPKSKKGDYNKVSPIS